MEGGRQNQIFNPANVSVQEFGARFQSKSECYRFLSSDCHVYLPSKTTSTIWFLKDLMSGKRTRVSCKDVKLIDVPHFEGLTINDALKWADSRPGKAKIMCAFPEELREIKKLPRAWILNIINTLDDDFGKWVEVQKKNRID